tara:strand:- start:14 stop:382 length:369 start_codon:yes stop_codon:yes gene_type:complete
MSLPEIDDVMRATAWKASRGDDDKPVKMKLQVDNIPGRRNFNRVLKSLESEEWQIIGEGLGQDKSFMAIFTRTFSSYAEWVKWGKQYPHYLKEISPKTDKPKRIKLGKGSQTRPGRPRKELR